MSREEIEAQVRRVERRCRGPLPDDVAKVVRSLLADGLLEEASRADEAGRKYCGYDFNDIICAGPFDGQEHEYVCPRCGVRGRYIAPCEPPAVAVTATKPVRSQQSWMKSLWLQLRGWLT